MNNRILISVLTTGLFTPIACAQESASQAKSSSVIAVTRGQGDPSPIDVSIKINDGRVESAQLNGEDIPSDRIRRVVDGFEILGADGAVLEHIAATHPDDKRSSASAGLRKAIRIAHGSEANAAQDAARALVVQDFALAVASESPKTMLGAGLGNVDAALAHHLGVDVAKSTMVTGLVDGLPAQKAGIEQFDVIVSVNGDADASSAALRKTLKDLEPGAKITLGIRRGADTKSVEFELVAFDAEKLSAIEAEDSSFTSVEGFEIPEIEQIIALDAAGQRAAGGAGTSMFFMGPDGRKQQILLPNMSHNMGGGAWSQSPGPSRDAMRMLEQRLMELTQRLEEQGQRRSGGAMNGRDGAREAFEFEIEGMNEDEAGARELNRQPNRSMQPRRNGDSGAPTDRSHAMGEDRLARLEAQMERVLRELERVNSRPRDGGDRVNDGAMRGPGLPPDSRAPRNADAP